ncbi:MAG: cob(I)yrinic acid a,c-diamide adenosyltransferase [Planctomycetota bacterium]|nr:MAG: cob(I)yrinic acid a,c-diamide adenosyltransferase [Planctomycetota bacterium]
MVRLDKIYTRGGDAGLTSLGDGTRVPKHHARIETYGTVDELGAVLGVCLANESDPANAARLTALQHDLFDLGADLCVPGRPEREEPGARLRIAASNTAALEAWIDELNAELGELKSFVLCGGTLLSANLHLARTVCRRAERCLLQLLEADEDNTNPEGLRYLNRLSDLLFVLARRAAGEHEILWKPGGGTSS